MIASEENNQLPDHLTWYLLCPENTYQFFICHVIFFYRRKRKWDTAEDDDAAAVKKALVEGGVHGEGSAEDLSGAQDNIASPVDAAAAAAAIAAAKLNAMLVAKGQAPALTPEANSSNSQGVPAPMADVGSDGSATATTEAGGGRPPARERDEFFKDIDINDVKHRYILTKGSVQTQVYTFGPGILADELFVLREIHCMDMRLTYQAFINLWH